MRPKLRAVGEVVLGWVLLIGDLGAGLVLHVCQQGLQEILLAGEVLVEGPCRPAGGGCDVGDLGVQVAVFDELPPRGVL